MYQQQQPGNGTGHVRDMVQGYGPGAESPAARGQDHQQEHPGGAAQDNGARACSHESSPLNSPGPGYDEAGPGQNPMSGQGPSDFQTGRMDAHGPAGSQPGPSMYMGGQPPQGHAHLQEHVTGQPSSVGMMASQQSGPAQPGPDMGQPHFARQIPGAPPYQGTPWSGHFPHPGQPGSYQQPGMQASGSPFQGPGQVFYSGANVQGGPGPGPGNGHMPGHMPHSHFHPGHQPEPGRSDDHGQGGMNSQGKGMENRYGELYGLINQAANGNADVSGFLRFFQNTSSDFWKGALVGSALTLLVTNDAVKKVLAGSLAGIWGSVSRSAEEMEAEEDRKAEEQAAKEKK